LLCETIDLKNKLRSSKRFIN